MLHTRPLPVAATASLNKRLFNWALAGHDAQSSLKRFYEPLYSDSDSHEPLSFNNVNHSLLVFSHASLTFAHQCVHAASRCVACTLLAPPHFCFARILPLPCISP